MSLKKSKRPITRDDPQPIGGYGAPPVAMTIIVGLLLGLIITTII